MQLDCRGCRIVCFEIHCCCTKDGNISNGILHCKGMRSLHIHLSYLFLMFSCKIMTVLWWPLHILLKTLLIFRRFWLIQCPFLLYSLLMIFVWWKKKESRWPSKKDGIWITWVEIDSHHLERNAKLDSRQFYIFDLMMHLHRIMLNVESITNRCLRTKRDSTKQFFYREAAFVQSLIDGASPVASICAPKWSHR